MSCFSYSSSFIVLCGVLLFISHQSKKINVKGKAFKKPILHVLILDSCKILPWQSNSQFFPNFVFLVCVSSQHVISWFWWCKWSRTLLYGLAGFTSKSKRAACCSNLNQQSAFAKSVFCRSLIPVKSSEVKTWMKSLKVWPLKENWTG